jgi:hypothetical protein
MYNVAPMRNWKQIAAALAPEIPEADLARVIPALDALEAVFRPLMHRAPHETEPAYIMLVTNAQSEPGDEDKARI